MPRVESKQRPTREPRQKTAGEAKSKAGKRTPSAYNIYVQEHLKLWKEKNPELPIRQGMAEVAAQWRNAPENPRRGAVEESSAKTGKKKSSRSKAVEAPEADE